MQTQWSYLNDVNIFSEKKSLKKNNENSISEIIDFKIFESIPVEPIATLIADLANLSQTSGKPLSETSELMV